MCNPIADTIMGNKKHVRALVRKQLHFLIVFAGNIYRLFMGKYRRFSPKAVCFLSRNTSDTRLTFYGTPLSVAV